MMNKTRALGFRLLGSLKNERVVIANHPGILRHAIVTLINGKTGKPFAVVRENEWGEYQVALPDGSIEWHESFVGAVHALKASPGYPKPRERKNFIRPVNRGTRIIGVKVG